MYESDRTVRRRHEKTARRSPPPLLEENINRRARLLSIITGRIEPVPSRNGNHREEEEEVEEVLSIIARLWNPDRHSPRERGCPFIARRASNQERVAGFKRAHKGI